ncbi:MAG: hypothetical protein RJB66_349 [Pseudomonadota bacterium]|jgi:general secretion pathway protein G
MNILKNSPLRNSRGMTLVEILIVLAIVGTLMAVIGGNVMGKFEKAKRKTTGIILENVSNAIQTYNSDCGKLPPTLGALIENPGAECADWGPEPYIKKDMLKDAWKHDLVYETDGGNFTLKSLGKDGREGGSKNDKDIYYDEKDASSEK